MKKLLLTTLALSSLLAVNAIPAKRIITPVEQPDGKILNITLCGDEFHSFYTTEDGYIIEKGADGYYYYKTKDSNGNIVLSDQIAHNSEERSEAEISFVTTLEHKNIIADSFQKLSQNRVALNSRAVITQSFPTKGEVKALVIMAEFQDVRFSEIGTNTEFSALLNEAGYSNYDATGSVCDYYKDQSGGLFNPRFDVVGPVTLPKNIIEYGAPSTTFKDCDPAGMVIDACNLAKELHNVDFSKYDNDNDGEADLIFVVFAGYGEAQGGGENTIWPHASSLYAFKKELTVDGIKIDKYACASELRDNSGINITGIGPFCHEFSHCLGLADLYDTTGSNCYGIGKWGIMDGGVYNNNSKTPPNFSAFERASCGWLEYEEFTESSSITLDPIDKSNKAYRFINPRNVDEYFVIENRQPGSWDTYLPSSGLLIHHIDYNAQMWANNTVNYDRNYPKAGIVPADNLRTSDTEDGDTYPGKTNNRTFSDITSPSSIFYTNTKWTKRITNITEDGDNITFDFHERLLDIPVADEATFITEDQFVANWNKVEDAESYTLYVNKYMGGDFIINESFDKFSAGSVSMPTSIDIADELDSYMNLAGWTGKFIYQAGGMIKIGDRNDSGSLISPLIDLSGVDGICNVSFSVRNRSNLSDMTVIVSQDKELSNVIFSETISVNNTLTDYSYNINNGVKECYFAILTTTSLIYVDDLKIVSGPDDKDLINDEKYIFAGITANNYIVGNLQPSTKYLYHVRADIGNVYSDDSQIITVVTKDNYSSIEKLTDDKSKVTVKGNTIQISSKRGDNLQVYTTSGILVKSILADSELTAFQLPKGFFIVKTEQWSEKIVITTTY